MSATHDPLLGSSLFGTYRITDKLGEGAMGAVYLAQRDDMGQKLALKVLHPSALADREQVERFRREGKVISMLSHPNVVRVFVHGETRGTPYMAMEYVEGTSLSRLLLESPLDEARAVHIAKQMCSALDEAHDLGILHRDVKPENTLLTEYRGETDYVKLLDFGLAKVNDSPAKLTRTGIVYGTPAYMSPEQSQGHTLDGRSDVYSVGCTLYEMVTGRVPFDGKTAIQVLEMQVFQAPTPPSEHRAVSPDLEAIILKSLAKAPDDRFQSAGEMLRALEAIDDAGAEELSWLPAEKLNQLATTTSWFWPAVLAAAIVGLVALIGALLAAGAWLAG